MSPDKLPKPNANRQETKILDASDAPQAGPDIAREAWLTVGLALLSTVGLNALGAVIPFVRANLVALFAVVFVQLPQYMLPRNGPGAEAYGFTWKGAARGVLPGLALTGIVLVGFLPGNHLWSTLALGHTLHVEPGAYARPSDRFHGEPPDHVVTTALAGDSADPGQPSVQYFHLYEVQYVRWTPDAGPWRLTVRSDAPLYRPDHRALGNELTVSGASPRPVLLSFRTTGAGAVTIEAIEDGARVDRGRMTVGPNAQPAPDRLWQDGQLRIPLGFGWLPLSILLQLVFIALPEEFFYRGYLQKRFDEAHGRRVAFRLGPIEVSRSNLLVSVIFGIGHVVIGLDPLRMAVFFPSLLFGWLRDRTGGLASSVVFHAACNLMVQWVAIHYWTA